MLFYRFIRFTFRVLARPMFRFRIEGAENLPAAGPGVVVAPHRSWLDPACIGGACPRPVRFLIIDRVYQHPWARWFYRSMQSIPVTAGGGPLTVTALRGALRALRNGQLIGVFPEGGVYSSDRPGSLHPGAAMLAARGGAPVIPIFIEGSAEAWPHGRSWPGPGRVRVRIGRALDPPEGHDREALREFLARIEARLEQLGREVSAA
jgi:1-acyl-sn-glycerol-3-phosphate acyltransferase